MGFEFVFFKCIVYLREIVHSYLKYMFPRGTCRMRGSKKDISTCIFS